MEEVTVGVVGAVWSAEESLAVLGMGEEEGAGTHLIVSRLVDTTGWAVPEEPYTLSTESGATCEGGIAEVAVVGAGLVVSLTEPAATDLGVPRSRLFRVGDPAVVLRVAGALDWLVEPDGAVPHLLFDTV